MAHASATSNSSFGKYARHLIELHSLAARGMNDSNDADEVRDLMDEPWARLTTKQKSRARGLSADLYTIGVDRPQPARASDEHTRQLAQLRDSEDWDSLLEFLREHEADLPPGDVARLRGICREQLGQPAVAVTFFREATRISPHEAINEVLELKALVTAGRIDEAVSRAKDISTRSPHECATRLLGASSILFQAADTPQGIGKDLLQLSIDTAERGLKLAKDEPADEILHEMRRSAYLRLGLSYLSKNEKHKAQSACQESLKLAPNDPDALILLAWIEREENPVLAEQHFRNGFLQELNRGTAERILHAPLL